MCWKTGAKKPPEVAGSPPPTDFEAALRGSADGNQRRVVAPRLPAGLPRVCHSSPPPWPQEDDRPGGATQPPESGGRPHNPVAGSQRLTTAGDGIQPPPGGGGAVGQTPHHALHCHPLWHLGVLACMPLTGSLPLPGHAGGPTTFIISAGRAQGQELRNNGDQGLHVNVTSGARSMVIRRRGYFVSRH